MGAVISAVFPVFGVVGIAYLLRRLFDLHARTLATLNIYFFLPSLVFTSLVQRTIEWPVFGRVAAATVLLTTALSLLAIGVARLRHMNSEQESAFLLSIFPNLGNFGLPVATFAFGAAEGLPLAVVVMVCGSLVQNSLGVYYAQRSHHGALRSLSHVFRFPAVYAFAFALLFQHLGWRAPESVPTWEGGFLPALGLAASCTLFRAIEIAAAGTIPIQLVILGLQLAETRLERGADMVLAVLLRLCAAPAAAFAMACVVGLADLPAKVFILQHAGPVAVGMAVYGVQFNVKPGFLASVVSWTFLFSILSVSVVLALLFRM